jgi:hypothetical protein
LRYLDQESHALWTNLEACLSQEGKKKSSTRALLTRQSCISSLFNISTKALDTLEDPGSSILSYRLQVTKGVFYYVPKKSQIFW